MVGTAAQLLFYTLGTLWARFGTRRLASYILCNGIIDVFIKRLLSQVLEWLDVNVVFICLRNIESGVAIIEWLLNFLCDIEICMNIMLWFVVLF